MSTHLEKQKPQEALSIFKRLIVGGHVPSLVTYTILLAALTAQKRFSHIHLIISQVRENRMKPDSIFFSAVVDAFSESGNMNEALKAFLKMKESRIKPTIKTFNSLINGYEKIGKPEESIKVFKLMSQEGNIKPNLRTYNLLVRIWCHGRNIKEACNMIKEMEASGFQPNIATYNTIALAYSQNGQTDQAECLISKMQKNGVHTTVKICGIIIEGYCKEGKLKDALRFVYGMKDLGIKPNLICFNSLIKEFVNISDEDGTDEVSHIYYYSFAFLICWSFCSLGGTKSSSFFQFIYENSTYY